MAVGVAFQAPPGSQASSQGEARTPLSSRVATRVSWSPLSGLKGPLRTELKVGEFEAHKRETATSTNRREQFFQVMSIHELWGSSGGLLCM